MQIIPKKIIFWFLINIIRLSSGGYMTVQLQVAHSATFKRAAVFSAGPYWNGMGNAEFADRACRGEP